MDRPDEDIIPVVEDRLRAVAVVGVKIDDSDAVERGCQDVGDNGCVVDIAESRSLIAVSVMPRRTASGDGTAFATYGELCGVNGAAR